MLLLAIALPAGLAATTVLVLTPTGERTSDGSPSGLARAAAVQSGSPRDGRAPRERPAPPHTISIPTAYIDAGIEPVAARGGVLRVPAVGRAGWYEGGARPGEPGRAVIIGHLDGRDGPGLFARVPRLPAGTAVSITDSRGAVHSYRVIGGARVEKDSFPADDVYGGAAGSVLVLVTCGGPFVEGEGYRDNVLVYARPI